MPVTRTPSRPAANASPSRRSTRVIPSSTTPSKLLKTKPPQEENSDDGTLSPPPSDNDDDTSNGMPVVADLPPSTYVATPPRRSRPSGMSTSNGNGKGKLSSGLQASSGMTRSSSTASVIAAAGGKSTKFKSKQQQQPPVVNKKKVSSGVSSKSKSNSNGKSRSQVGETDMEYASESHGMGSHGGRGIPPQIQGGGPPGMEGLHPDLRYGLMQGQYVMEGQDPRYVQVMPSHSSQGYPYPIHQQQHMAYVNAGSRLHEYPDEPIDPSLQNAPYVPSSSEPSLKNDGRSRFNGRNAGVANVGHGHPQGYPMGPGMVPYDPRYGPPAEDRRARASSSSSSRGANSAGIPNDGHYSQSHYQSSHLGHSHMGPTGMEYPTVPTQRASSGSSRGVSDGSGVVTHDKPPRTRVPSSTARQPAQENTESKTFTTIGANGKTVNIPPPAHPHLRPGDTITDPATPHIHGCPYCDKVYVGQHARSICRRHQMSKHGIELDVQVKKSRWDNNPNRPATEEEKHQRTLESKRRWAAKDRRRRRCEKMGIPFEDSDDDREEEDSPGVVSKNRNSNRSRSASNMTDQQVPAVLHRQAVGQYQEDEEAIGYASEEEAYAPEDADRWGVPANSAAYNVRGYYMPQHDEYAPSERTHKHYGQVERTRRDSAGSGHSSVAQRQMMGPPSGYPQSRLGYAADGSAMARSVSASSLASREAEEEQAPEARGSDNTVHPSYHTRMGSASGNWPQQSFQQYQQPVPYAQGQVEVEPQYQANGQRQVQQQVYPTPAEPYTESQAYAAPALSQHSQPAELDPPDVTPEPLITASAPVEQNASVPSGSEQDFHHEPTAPQVALVNKHSLRPMTSKRTNSQANIRAPIPIVADVFGPGVKEGEPVQSALAAAFDIVPPAAHRQSRKTSGSRSSPEKSKSSGGRRSGRKQGPDGEEAAEILLAISASPARPASDSYDEYTSSDSLGGNTDRKHRRSRSLLSNPADTLVVVSEKRSDNTEASKGEGDATKTNEIKLDMVMEHEDEETPVRPVYDGAFRKRRDDPTPKSSGTTIRSTHRSESSIGDSEDVFEPPSLARSVFHPSSSVSRRTGDSPMTPAELGPPADIVSYRRAPPPPPTFARKDGSSSELRASFQATYLHSSPATPFNKSSEPTNKAGSRVGITPLRIGGQRSLQTPSHGPSGLAMESPVAYQFSSPGGLDLTHTLGLAPGSPAADDPIWLDMVRATPDNHRGSKRLRPMVCTEDEGLAVREDLLSPSKKVKVEKE